MSTGFRSYEIMMWNSKKIEKSCQSDLSPTATFVSHLTSTVVILMPV